jgi:GTP cyclohydrolase IA
MIKLTHKDISTKILDLSKAILKTSFNHRSVYGVPRGGIPVAYMLSKMIGAIVVDNVEDADIIVDDLVDSGKTKQKYKELYPDKPFYALFTKGLDIENVWIQFPWEETSEVGGAEDIPTRLLQFIGEDVERGGLLETPKRYLKAWKDFTKGYDQKPEDVLKVFEDGAEKYDQMVLVKDIDVYSQCEHHLVPFFGTASVAYIPNGKVVGLSKIPRLIEVFARRLQVQERLTNQIASSLEEHLKPLGVAVVIKCRHMCMEARGIQKVGSYTTTSAMTGVFREEGNNARSEFLQLLQLPPKVL